MKSHSAFLSKFLVVFTLIASLLIAYLHYRYVRGFIIHPAARRSAILFLVVSLVSIIGTPLLIRSGWIEYRSLTANIGFHAVYLAMALLATWVLYSFMVEPIYWSIGLVNPERRKFISDALKVGVLGTGVASTAIGFAQAKLAPKVRQIEIPLKELPQALDGYRIVHISDLHVGPTIGRDEVERLVHLVNGFDADAIAVTGDLIDGSVDLLKNDIEPLGKMKSKDGIFYCNGNHEYFYNAEDWSSHLKSIGFKVLENRHEVVKRGEHALVFGGVNDFDAKRFDSEHTSDPHLAASGSPENATKILLAHQPKSCFQAAKSGWHLQLSGHVHAGQFFPFSLLVRFAHPYIDGLHHHEDRLWVYISRGTGYWGPPVRTLIPREIGVVTLRRANPSA